MGNEHNFKYYAFISYKREDEEWAKWLQHKLEHYKLPSNLNGRTDLPKAIRPIFRDQSDLAGGVLANEINKALESSKYLIVICSPRAAQSEWVGKEVQAFIDMGRSERIIPFIVGGTANAQDSKDECFPKTLQELHTEQNLSSVNINDLGRDAAAVKVVAQMFGLKFDELWERYKNDQKKRKWLTITAIASAVIVISALFSLVFLEKQSHNAEYDAKLSNESRRIADLSYDLVDAGNPYLAQRLLLEVLPKNLKHPNRPYTIEAEAALRHATLHNYTDLGAHNDAHFSPDGKYIVVASNDRITLWNAQTRDTVKTLGHIHRSYQRNYWRYSVFSPDGKKIVSARGDTTVIWDVEKGSAILTIKENENSATLSANFSPDGKRIISMLENDQIKIWDAETGASLTTFEYNTNYWIEPTFSPDGKYFFTELNDTVWIWDAKTIKKTKALDHFYMPTSAVFSPDGKLIATLTDHNELFIWDIEEGKKIKNLHGVSACFFSNGKRLASINDNGTLHLWDASNWDYLYQIQLFKTGKIEFGTNTELLLRNKSIGYYHQDDYECHLFLVDLEYCNSYHALKGHPQSHYLWGDEHLRVKYSPDGKYVVSYSEKGPVTLWDAATGKDLHTLKSNNDQDITNIMFGDKDQMVIIRQHSAVVWDLNTNKSVKKIEPSEFEDLLAISCDYKKSVSSLGEHMLCHDEDGNCLWRIKKAHDNYISTASFSPDEKNIVTTAEESTIKIWDSETGELLHTLNGHTDIVNSAAFNGDGNRIVSTSNDHTIKVWDIEKEQPIHTLDVGYDIATYAFFSPDDKLIVSPTGIWNIDSEIKLQSICADACACFSPDGKNLVLANSDGSIFLWHFPTLQEVIDQTRKHFQDRPITDKEREKYSLIPIK